MRKEVDTKKFLPNKLPSDAISKSREVERRVYNV